MAKNLFLASKWSEPNIIPLIEEFHDGYKDKRIVFIPTSGSGEFGYDWRKASKYLRLLELNANIHVIDLDKQEYNMKNEIKPTDVIYVAGGSVGYLMYWIRRQDCMQDLMDIINSGVKYVGSSAGAMILGQTIQAGEFVHLEEEKNIGDAKGIGLLDYDFLPHYDPTQLDKVKKLYKGNRLYMLKNNEAIIYREDKMSFVGNPVLYENSNN
jgi:dipeptidase E